MGEKWSHSTTVNALQMYCIYEYAMGLNGILEALLNGTIDAVQISAYRTFTFVTTIVYIALAVALSAHGAAGLIATSILSMGMRIFYCTRFTFRTLFGSGKKDREREKKKRTKLYFTFLNIKSFTNLFYMN
jgi:O-antigen/teichoic acid export membrane protein